MLLYLKNQTKIVHEVYVNYQKNISHTNFHNGSQILQCSYVFYVHLRARSKKTIPHHSDLWRLIDNAKNKILRFTLLSMNEGSVSYPTP